MITNLTYLFSLQSFSYFWYSMISSISCGSRPTQNENVEHKGLTVVIPQSKYIFRFIDYKDNRLEWDNSIFLRRLIPTNKWRLNIIQPKITTKVIASFSTSNCIRRPVLTKGWFDKTFQVWINSWNKNKMYALLTGKSNQILLLQGIQWCRTDWTDRQFHFLSVFIRHFVNLTDTRWLYLLSCDDIIDKCFNKNVFVDRSKQFIFRKVMLHYAHVVRVDFVTATNAIKSKQKK